MLVFWRQISTCFAHETAIREPPVPEVEGLGLGVGNSNNNNSSGRVKLQDICC